MLLSSVLAARQQFCRVFPILVTAALLGAQTPPTNKNSPPQLLPPGMREVLSAIQPSSLRGNLSFLASDALAGRYTPSPELDIAAEFIASQFRAAGLKPAGDRDYFQIASMVDRKMPKPEAALIWRDEDGEITIPPASIAVVSTSAPVKLDRWSVVLAKAQDPDTLHGVELKDKVVLAPSPNFENATPEQQEALLAKRQAFQAEVRDSGARALIVLGRVHRAGSTLLSEDKAKVKLPSLAVESADLRKRLEKLTCQSGCTVSFDIPAPEDRKVSLKNVVAVLPGSDPKFKDTYVLLTAHYDHIGTLATGKELSPQKPSGSDGIYNGANDDGSGTVSVIEIAKAMAKVKPRPKRSIVFMTFFGEERGDIGSGYYGDHPLFPIANTVADLNLEQVGRTDSTEGKKLNNVSVTGFDYSDITKYLGQAGQRTGINVYLEKPASDEYFVRSDNAALAEQGVPAHTLCVAFDYADYHGLADEWPKIDYDNMARVDRMVALALFNLANSSVAPRWNQLNPKTAPFREAQSKKRSNQPAGNSRP